MLTNFAQYFAARRTEGNKLSRTAPDNSVQDTQTAALLAIQKSLEELVAPRAARVEPAGSVPIDFADQPFGWNAATLGQFTARQAYQIVSLVGAKHDVEELHPPGLPKCRWRRQWNGA